MAWRRKTRRARPRRVKQHSDGTVYYHHCNRLDPCSKQSPFLFELSLVFGFSSSRILGCDQYFHLNWEQRCFLDCCMAGVCTALYWNSLCKYKLSWFVLTLLLFTLQCKTYVGGRTGWREMHCTRSKTRLEQESQWQMLSFIDEPQ